MRHLAALALVALFAGCGGEVIDETTLPATYTPVHGEMARVQPRPAPKCDPDFETGNSMTGWRCLKFRMPTPQSN